VHYSVLDDPINPLSGDMLCVEITETITRPSLGFDRALYRLRRLHRLLLCGVSGVRLVTTQMPKSLMRWLAGASLGSPSSGQSCGVRVYWNGSGWRTAHGRFHARSSAVTHRT
jgi:hypothetical protein